MAALQNSTTHTPKGGFKGAFEFVHLSHPDDAASQKHRVRSHASRNPAARRKRVSRHQEELQKKPNDTRKAPKTLIENHVALSYEHYVGSANVGFTLMALSAARTDPFDTFVRNLTAFEAFLLDHFTQTVALQAPVCAMFPSLVEEIKFRHNIARQWVQMSAADAGVLSTVLLTACRNLALHQNSIKLSTVALQYKVLTISSLNEALSREGELISDNTIIKTLALASESKVIGDLAATKRHLEAMGRMVELRGVYGGDMKEPVDLLVFWFLNEHQMVPSAVLRRL